MATEGGPIFPHSAAPTTDEAFPNVHVGGGANSKQDVGMGVDAGATLAADAIWQLRFQMPATLPTGTMKLRLKGIANASSGVMAVNPKWAGVGEAEDPSGAALSAEGDTSITFVAADDYITTYITLDAFSTIAGKDELVMDLTFVDTAATTITAVTTWIASIVWE